MAAGRWVALPNLFLLASAWLLLLLLLISRGAGAFEIFLRHGDDMTVVIRPPSPNKCALRREGKEYFTELKISPGERVNFAFSCETPEKFWTLVIEKNIDCMSKLCPFGDVLLQPSGLPPLNRTFVWEVKTNQVAAVELKFSTQLRQIRPGDVCSDGILYNIGNRLHQNRVSIGTFCRNGSVSRVKVQGGAILTLQLPWNSKFNTSGFKLESTSSIQRLCIIESTFQNESSATLMSANYPQGLPEDELMTWQFNIPFNLRADVFFRNHTNAHCERKYQRLEYKFRNGERKEVPLDGVQPVNIAGSFSLSLQGCDQYDKDPGALSLLFEVVVRYPENEENITHVIDLRGEKSLNISIHSKLPQAGASPANEHVCWICIGTSKNCGPNVTLLSGSMYSVTFLCPNLENLRITAEQSIVCWNSRYCQMRRFDLLVPSSLTKLPILVEKFTWKLQAPEDTAIEIRSPNLKLKQHIPNQEQKCSGSYIYDINGTTLGKELKLGLFCPGGTIEKIQMKDNATITLKTYGKRWFNDSQKQDLQLFFVPSIQEDCVFSVTPDTKARVYFQTPNWLEGLPPLMSVYWNISVPAKQTAELGFSKERLGITCRQSRAYISIEEQAPNGKKTVCRDDQNLPKTLALRHHFWVNITNCKPPSKQQLAMQFVVSFAQKKTDIAIIIGVVVGVVAVLAAVGLAVCCVKKKKKNIRKESQAPVVGVYNTNINTQLPVRQGVFKKGRKDNESHVYAVIDEASVYGHLLDTTGLSENAEVGVYRPFSGPMSTTPPSPPPIRKPSKVPETEESSFILMTDNENYTFARPAPEELQSNGVVSSNENPSKT